MSQSGYITFVTTSNLATNPRLIKEVDRAVALSYNVTIVAFHFNNWSLPLNEEIKKRLADKVTLIEVPAGRKPLLPWAVSTLLQITCKAFVKAGLQNSFALSQALQKRSLLLIQALKKLKQKPTLMIAHNPGSFYPVMQYAQKEKIPFGIDVEDYHPGETNDAVAGGQMRKLMQQTIQHAAYVSAAAPLILEEVKKDCADELPVSRVVLNYFSSTEFQQPQVSAVTALRLVWFSQYIAEGRGLELLLEAIKDFSTTVELHLYGHLHAAFQQQYLEKAHNVFVHAPLTQQQLHTELAGYDVGVALENAGANYNRDICITNKLLAYYQAGLYILASQTKAQKDFVEQKTKHGVCVTVTAQNLAGVIQQLVNEKQSIRTGAAERFRAASAFSAENEILQLSTTWSNIVANRPYAV
ncbi:MAG: hypothetical protein ACOVP7_04380 [Lacibacter sp.]